MPESSGEQKATIKKAKAVTNEMRAEFFNSNPKTAI